MNIKIEDLLDDSDRTISDGDGEDDEPMSKLLPQTPIISIHIQSVQSPCLNEAKMTPPIIRYKPQFKRPSTKSTRGRWTIVEQKQFLYCLLTYKTDWSSYCSKIKTRSLSQIITHIKNFVLYYRKQRDSAQFLFAASKVGHLIRTHGAKYGFDFSESEFAQIYHIIFENDDVLKLYQKSSKPIFSITKEIRKKEKDKAFSFLQKKTYLDSVNTINTVNSVNTVNTVNTVEIEEDYYMIRSNDFYSPFGNLNDAEDYEQSTI